MAESATGGNSRRRSTRRHAALVITTAIVVAVDIGTKVWSSAALRHGEIDLPGPLDLELARNHGAAFSLFADAPPSVIIAITGAVTLAVAIAALREMLPAIPAGLILGGAAANVANRVVQGSVVDMLHTGWWPTFNVADAALTIGVGLLILMSLRASGIKGHDAGQHLGPAP